MRQKAKFIQVTEIRPINFTNREGIQKSLVSVSYQIQWLIYSESGKTYTQDLVVESLINPDQLGNLKVGPITDEQWYDMQINFSVNRSRDGRYFNSIRLTQFSPVTL